MPAFVNYAYFSKLCRNYASNFTANLGKIPQ